MVTTRTAESRYQFQTTFSLMSGSLTFPYKCTRYSIFQGSFSCQSDKLTIKDEHGGVRLCGEGTDKLPGIKHFTGSQATFHFRSDSSVQKTGFRLDYNMTRLTEGHCMCSTGSSYMCITNFNRKVRRVWHRIKFSIKTSQKRGLIVYSHKGNYRDYMYIAIQDGKMYYKSDLGTGPSIAVSHGQAINDDQWHYVEIRRRKRTLTIAVDNGRAVGSAKTKGNFNRIDLDKATGYVLGTPPQLQGMPNFIGCIRDFTIDGREPLTNSYVAKPDYHGHGIKGMNKC
ncbi:Neurexin-3 [Exaiptasia diaphana]|nr:Neurexin-3 [Exaiptasia diaphana]